MKIPNIHMPRFSKMYFETSDFRQVCTIAKNETIKSVRSRRFVISLIIIALMFALITIIPIMAGNDISGKGYGNWVSGYLSHGTLFVTIIVALLGSVALVSEYEERTALILLTRPVKKTTVFVGKFLSSFLLCAGMMALYYVGILIVGFFYFPQPSNHLFESLAMCLMYVFAASCIAFMFSSIFKKSSVSIVATILVLMIVIPIISAMINGDKSFMLDFASNSTLTCIPEYVQSHNDSVKGVIDYFEKIIDVLNNSGIEDKDTYIQITEDIRDIILKIMTPLSEPNLLKNALVMFAWGAVALVVSWIKFLRKQF